MSIDEYNDYVPCATEDSVGPCYWDASTMGNGDGMSFYITHDQQFIVGELPTVEALFDPTALVVVLVCAAILAVAISIENAWRRR